MKPFGSYILLHVVTAIAATVALWCFALPTRPAEALADGIAAAVSGFVEIVAIRLR